MIVLSSRSRARVDKFLRISWMRPPSSLYCLRRGMLRRWSVPASVSRPARWLWAHTYVREENQLRTGRSFSVRICVALGFLQALVAYEVFSRLGEVVRTDVRGSILLVPCTYVSQPGFFCRSCKKNLICEIALGLFGCGRAIGKRLFLMVLMLCIFYRHRKNEGVSWWGFFGNKGEIKKGGGMWGEMWRD